MAVIREIVGFGNGEELVFCHEFSEEKVPELRPLFDYGDDDGLHAGSYELTDANRDRVAAILGIQLQPDVDYFIETSTRQ